MRFQNSIFHCYPLYSNWKFLRFGLNFLLWGSLLSLLSPALLWAQACTPTSATLTVAGDDTTSVWIDGSSIGTFAYDNWNSTTALPSMSVPVSLLTSYPGYPQVCFEIETQNTAPNVNYTAWDLDITCSGGN